MTSKAKKYSIISAILLLAVVSSYIYAQMPALAQNITSNISTTRYILFGGAYDVNGSSNSANSVFKLDTYTGNAWMLASSKDAKGKVKNIWVAVDNPPDPQTIIPEEQPQIKELDDSND
ncbi:MAG: hypothetical protein WCR55_00860 [Lentisphaerota bacterium]